MSRRTAYFLIFAYLRLSLAHPAILNSIPCSDMVDSRYTVPLEYNTLPAGVKFGHPADMVKETHRPRETDGSGVVNVCGDMVPQDVPNPLDGEPIQDITNAQNSGRPQMHWTRHTREERQLERQGGTSQKLDRLAKVKKPSKPPVVFIHGLWMTSSCWKQWVQRFEERGYTVYAPSWPGIGNRSPQDIRRDPSALDDRSVLEIIDYYMNFIQNLKQQPILIGHSFGGLFTQMLLSKGFGAAGVAISPAPPAGVFDFSLSTLRSAFPVLSKPRNFRGTVGITADQFHYNFGNHLTNAESNLLWEEYSIPAVSRVLWDGALGMLGTAFTTTQVKFDKADRAPLLLIAGTNDNVVPRSAVEKTFKAYKNKKNLEFVTFEKRTHGILLQNGWEEVADTAMAFVSSKLGYVTD